MLFAADIGNTSIDIGVFDDAGKLLSKSKISTVKNKTPDEYSVTINEILSANGYQADAISGSIISSVVPSVTRTIKEAVKKTTGTVPLEVGPGIKTGLNIKIDVQAQLGADIVAASVIAVATHRAPVIVIDVGTATTFTAINCDGVLEGVMIAPGIRVALDALAESAAWLTDVSLTAPKHFIGKNTNDSMISGVLYGHAFMIDGFVGKLRKIQGFSEASVVITGGLAETVLPLCSVNAEYDPDLVLKGLALIYRKNKK